MTLHGLKTVPVNPFTMGIDQGFAEPEFPAGSKIEVFNDFDPEFDIIRELVDCQLFHVFCLFVFGHLKRLYHENH